MPHGTVYPKVHCSPTHRGDHNTPMQAGRASDSRPQSTAGVLTCGTEAIGPIAKRVRASSWSASPREVPRLRPPANGVLPPSQQSLPRGGAQGALGRTSLYLSEPKRVPGLLQAHPILGLLEPKSVVWAHRTAPSPQHAQVVLAAFEPNPRHCSPLLAAQVVWATDGSR